MISSTSPPEQNPRPSPVITSTGRRRGAGAGDQITEVCVGLERESIQLVGPVQVMVRNTIAHVEIEVPAHASRRYST